jgi:hypothetical protein
VARTISIHVEYIEDVPQPIDALLLVGCGGSGEYRYFDTTPLDTTPSDYDVELEAHDISDDFTLEPGEFEVFVLNFRCRAPGVYGITLEIPVEYEGSRGIFYDSSTPNLVCPQVANYHIGEPEIDPPDTISIGRVERYVWTGSGYELDNP